MKNIVGRVCALAVPLLFLTGSDVAAQTAPSGSLTVPVAGTAAQGVRLNGTLAVNRFETRGNQIVAIGFISGTLTQGNHTLGTALAGELVVPVTVRAGGVTAVRGRAALQQSLSRVAFSSGGRALGLRVAQAEGCPVVDVVLGPFSVNVLGIDVFIAPVEIHLTGQQGTPLGDLVCEVSELIGNVAGLVGVLNNILGLLIALLGGLTGGIGGIGGV
jgi:hypothetical protein